MPALSRQWTVFLIPHTHTDIGYTDSQPTVLEQHLEYLDQVIEFCCATEHEPQASRFCWTCEVGWQLIHYRRNRPEAKFLSLIELIKQGRVELSGLYLNFTELLDLPMIVRSCAPLAAIQQEFGITISSAMCSDINGLPWGFAKVLPSLGVKFLSMASNATRALPRPPRFFRWQSNDGQKLLLWDGPIYGMANILGFGRNGEGARERLTGYLSELEASAYPYDAIALRVQGHLGDNIAPAMEICDQVRQWNARQGPRLSLCTNTTWFEYASSALDLSRAKVIRGGFPDWWSDGLGATPKFASAVLGAQRRLRQGKAGLDPSSKAQAIDDVLFASEHTFGATMSVVKPDDPNAVSQWAYKQAFSTRAAGVLPDPVNWDIPQSTEWKVLDADKDIETPLYRLKVSSASGGLISLVDKELDWNVVSNARGTDFNCWLLERIVSPEGRHVLWDDDMVTSETHHQFWVVNRSKSRVRREARFSHTKASLKSTSILRTDSHIWIRCNVDLPGCSSVSSFVRVWTKEKRIDLIHRIDRQRDDSPSSLYLAFPTSLCKPTIHVHSAGGAFVPGQQIPLTASDYYYVDDWVAIGDSRYSMYWASLDAPLVQFGGPRMGRWSESFADPGSEFFSWATNNYWYTNFPASQHGTIQFRYSMTTQMGSPDLEFAEKFSQKVTGDYEMRANLPLRLDETSVVLRQVEHSSDGREHNILLEEIAGLECDVPVDASAAAAYECDLYGHRTSGQALRTIQLKPFELKAVKLIEML